MKGDRQCVITDTLIPIYAYLTLPNEVYLFQQMIELKLQTIEKEPALRNPITISRTTASPMQNVEIGINIHSYLLLKIQRLYILYRLH